MTTQVGLATSTNTATCTDMGRGKRSDITPLAQLTRFHEDPAPHLTGYGVFYGDDRMVEGPPLPTGSLRVGDKSLRGGSTIVPEEDYIPGTTQLRTNISLADLKAKAGIADYKTQGTATSDTMGAESNVGNGSIFNFATGTYATKSGLVPQHDKQWIPEYTDEYKTPQERLERVETMTMKHGTQSAMKDSRYQFRGYPYSNV